MTLYGYARVSVREPEDKNLDLQVERLVRAGCAMGNIRAEEASGAKDDRGGLLELLDLVVEGDTLVVTHIDRLSRGLTYGLQVIEGLHLAGVEFRSLAEVSRVERPLTVRRPRKVMETKQCRTSTSCTTPAATTASELPGFPTSIWATPRMGRDPRVWDGGIISTPRVGEGRG